MNKKSIFDISCIREYYNNKLFSDVKINGIYLHKLILSQNKFFKTMFLSEFSETGMIDITMENEVLLVIKLCYGFDIDNIVSFEDFKLLLYLIDKYLIDFKGTRIEEIIIRHILITPTSLLKTLDEYHLIEEYIMKRHTYVKKNRNSTNEDFICTMNIVEDGYNLKITDFNDNMLLCIRSFEDDFKYFKLDEDTVLSYYISYLKSPKELLGIFLQRYMNEIINYENPIYIPILHDFQILDIRNKIEIKPPYYLVGYEDIGSIIEFEDMKLTFNSVTWENSYRDSFIIFQFKFKSPTIKTESHNIINLNKIEQKNNVLSEEDSEFLYVSLPNGYSPWINNKLLFKLQ